MSFDFTLTVWLLVRSVMVLRPQPRHPSVHSYRRGLLPPSRHSASAASQPCEAHAACL